MRVADFEGDEFLPRVAGRGGYGAGLDSGAVADADQAQDGRVAFADAQDVVVQVSAGGACAVVRALVFGLS